MHSGKLFSIKVRGAFDLFDRHGQSVRPAGRKDCALLAMLALTGTHRQTRTWLQEKLWGDRGPAQGAASLRQALTTLRAVLNGGAEVLRADRTWVWLDPALCDDFNIYAWQTHYTRCTPAPPSGSPQPGRVLTVSYCGGWAGMGMRGSARSTPACSTRRTNSA